MCRQEGLSLIHPQAIVDPKAEIDEGVEVGPWSLIGPGVKIGKGSWVGPHVVLKGPTELGKNNRIYQFCSIGEDCQDLKYNGEPTRLLIGDNNVIRESTTIHRGTIQDRGITQIGNDNLIMGFVHIAHDCVVGNHVIMSNNTTLAGHVNVGNHVIFGGFSKVHQYCKIGSYSMSGADSLIVKDVPAFVMVMGSTASAHGMNFEGMRRKGFEKDEILRLRKAYKIVYRQKNLLSDAISLLSEEFPDCKKVALFIESLKNSERGITR